MTDRTIPVVPTGVDRVRTGAVKGDPGARPNGFAIGQRHDLPAASASRTKTQRHHQIHGPFPIGLDRFEARSAIVSALGRAGSSQKRRTCTPWATNKARETTVEPRLSNLNWAKSIGPLKTGRGDAVRQLGRDHQKELSSASLRLGRQHARLVHPRASMVEPPHSDLVRPGRRGHLRRTDDEVPTGEGSDPETPMSSTPGSPRALWPFHPLGWPGRPDLASSTRPTSC